MDAYILVKTLHILSATVLFGTGIGSAFYMQAAQIPLGSAWLVAGIALYVLAGACWVPAVVMQVRMRNLASAAVASSMPLPEAYWRCFRAWMALGLPAFTALVAVFWLMVAKPANGGI